MEKLYYTAKEKLTGNYLLKAFMSELAESAVSILTAKYMTYVIRQHKGKE